MRWGLANGCNTVNNNPIHIKRFAGAIGQRAKTDKLDAQLIAHYGEAIKPKLSTLKPDIMQAMSDLVARRNQLLVMQTMEKNRLQSLPKSLESTIKSILTAFKNQIQKIESKIVKLIESCPEYQTKNMLFQSMKGIGKIAAASIISNLPELGYMSNKQACALVGVAPMNRESGRFKGVRKIQGGRHQVRTVLYMAMMSAIQSNPVFKETYQRLVAARKAKKSRYYCLSKKDGCDLKFDAQGWGYVGSAKSLKIAIDAIVSCYVN